MHWILPLLLQSHPSPTDDTNTCLRDDFSRWFGERLVHQSNSPLMADKIANTIRRRSQSDEDVADHVKTGSIQGGS